MTCGCHLTFLLAEQMLQSSPALPHWPAQKACCPVCPASLLPQKNLRRLLSPLPTVSEKQVRELRASCCPWGWPWIAELPQHRLLTTVPAQEAWQTSTSLYDQ